MGTIATVCAPYCRGRTGLVEGHNRLRVSCETSLQLLWVPVPALEELGRDLVVINEEPHFVILTKLRGVQALLCSRRQPDMTLGLRQGWSVLGGDSMVM